MIPRHATTAKIMSNIGNPFLARGNTQRLPPTAPGDDGARELYRNIQRVRKRELTLMSVNR